MQKIILLPVVMTLALLGAGCGDSTTITPATNTTKTNTTSNTTTPTTAQAVTIKNFAFTPATVTVKVGTTVTWTNQDTVAHDVTGDAFTSETLNIGDTFEFSFDKAGTYQYICSLHPTMKGTIVVE